MDDHRHDTSRLGALSRRQLLQAGAVSLAGASALFNAPAAFAQKADPNDPVLGPLIEGARKEGTVTIVGNLLQKAEGRRGFAETLKEYYGLPASFNVNWLVKGNGPTQKQVEDELAANRVSVDVVKLNVVGWADSLAKRGKLMSFESPEYNAYDHMKDRPTFVNRPYYVCDPGYLFTISWNSEVIKDNKFESWFDLLRPEYKGRITSQAARLAPSAAICFYGMKNDPKIGPDFFKRLSQLDVSTIQLSEQGADKVVSGEFPICLGAGTRIFAYWQQGAKHLRLSFPKEGTVLLPNYWLALAGAPRPNAAKLVVNFARTQVGAQLMADLEARMSSRLDIKSPNPDFVPSIKDKTWISVDQTKITQQDMRALGDEWRNLFGT